MQSLNEKTWEPIAIGLQFNLCRGRESKSTVVEGGKLPFVSAKKTDNGYRMFVEPAKTKIDGNTISLNNNGDGGAGFGYYQPYEYTVDVNTTALIPLPHVPMNPSIGLFWVSCFSWMHEYFGNARTLSNKRAEVTKTMLPVNDSGEPDYAYMAEYAQQKREAMLAKYRTYVEARIAELGEVAEIPALDEKEWRGFEIGQIFKTNQRGKKTYMPTGALVDAGQLGDGMIPRIRVTAQNNGINGFTNDSDDGSFRTFENFVSVSFLGSAFYHPYKASLDMKVHCLQLKSREMNSFIGLFIAVMMQNNTQGTTYGNQLSSEDLVSKHIFLPIDDNGEPDYAYMEQYVKNLMLKKYRQYLRYLDQR